MENKFNQAQLYIDNSSKNESFRVLKKDNKLKRDKQYLLEALTVFLLAHIRHPEFHDYEPDTIKELMGLELIEVEELLAAQNIWHNLSFFEDCITFEKTSAVFNQRHMNVEIHQELTSAEICWAIKCARFIDSMTLFNDDVMCYVATILHHDGLVKIPKYLEDEESFLGLGFQYYLNKANNHHEPHENEIHNEILDNINKYVESRQHKLDHELVTEEV